MVEKKQSVYKGLSKRTKELLQKTEGVDVEYKRDIQGLDVTDLVAFANSLNGGVIFIGIEEIEGENGLQQAKIFGCSVSDRDKLIIGNKAEDCVPPIEIEIFIENSSHNNPFFRIEIPSGQNKPYCTKKGVYSIRGDGRTKPLNPERLLTLFIEAEGETFLRRFRNATEHITRTLDNLQFSLQSETMQIMDVIQEFKDQVNNETGDILGDLRDLRWKIDDSLEGIFASAQGAEALSDEAMGISDQVLGIVANIDEGVDNNESKLYELDRKLDALLEKFDIEDPFITDIRKNIRVFLQYELKQGNDIELDAFVKKFYQALPVPIMYMSILDKLCREELDKIRGTHPKDK